MPFRAMLLALVLLAATGLDARAGLTLTYGTPVSVAGGGYVIDVMVAGDSTSYDFNNQAYQLPDFTAGFSITGGASNSGQLQFIAPPPSGTPLSPTASPNYIFYKNSTDNGDNPSDPLHPNTPTPQQTFPLGPGPQSVIASDTTADGNNKIVKPGESYLLTRLYLAPYLPLGPNDTFTIGLTHPNGSPSDNSYNTGSYFFTQKNTATIGIAFVPEPSVLVHGLTVVLLACGAGALRAGKKGIN